MEPRDARIPVTILTGFLGAGKTTLLNRILGEPHAERIAVIENEFGEAGIDSDLLVHDAEERIVAMNNGCICCTVRGDLIRILGELAARRAADPHAFGRVVVETTGLADPAPVAQTFFVDDAVGAAYRLDAIVTVVDAVHAERQLEQFHEAQEQVAFADRILLSKTDLVDSESLARLRARLRRLNPRAPLAEAHFGRTPIGELLDVGGFALDAALDIDPQFLVDATHEHDEAIGSFVFRATLDFDGDRLQAFLRDAIAEHGADLLRYKGIVAFAGEAHRVVFQGVHMLLAADAGRAWAPGEARESTLVFIGRDLPRARFERDLRACLSEPKTFRETTSMALGDPHSGKNGFM